MRNQTNTHGMQFASASNVPGFQDFGPRTVSLARRRLHRIPLETIVIGAVCSVVSALMVTENIDRNQLLADYDLKLRSYGDRLTLFTLATLPSVAGLAVIYVTFRGVQGIRAMFSLK